MTDAEKLRAIEFLLNDDDYRDFVRDCGADDMADTFSNNKCRIILTFSKESTIILTSDIRLRPFS